MLWFLCYVATIFGANWALETYGFISVGFGLTAPAGVLFAGLSFTFRDLLQESRGRFWSLAAIAIGAGLSYFISPTFALASAVAFGASELADFAVYTPIRKRHWLTAVTLSNTVGLVLDSVLFLWIAFGSLDFIAGQIVGKAEMTALAIIVLWIVRNRDLPVWLRVRQTAVGGGCDADSAYGQQVA